MAFDDLEYLSESEIKSEFIPGGSVLNFVPGGDDAPSAGVPGKPIENGRYIGVVRTWGEDRRVDRSVRIVEDNLEEKVEYYFEGEQFFSDGWDSSIANWDVGTVRLPEGYKHTLRSYIELLLESWSHDDINEIWWEKFQEHY